MPLILVVEQEEGVVTHLRRTLEQQGGWRLHHARTVQEAMQRMASEAPELFVVSTAVTGAGSLLGPFARRQGGPGTLALIPEQQAPPPERLAEAGLGADAALAKPVTGEQVLDAARSILKAGEKAAPASTPDEPKLTSHDIFGDLVEEVEREDRGGRPSPERPVESRPAAPPDEPSARPPKQTDARSTPRPDRAPPARRLRADDDIERRLEQTLSGVLAGGPKRKPRKKEPDAGDVRPPGAGSRPDREDGEGEAGPARPKRRARGASDVDDLLSKTLSGLDLPRRKKPAAPKPPPSPEAPPDRPPEQMPEQAADQPADRLRERDPDRALPKEPPSAPAAREPSPREVPSPEPPSAEAEGAPPWAAPTEPPSEPSAEPQSEHEASETAETAGPYEPSEPPRPEPVPPSLSPPEPPAPEPLREETPSGDVAGELEQAFAGGFGEEAGGRTPAEAGDEEAGEATPPSVPFEPQFADTLEEVPDAVGEVGAASEAPVEGGEVPPTPPPVPEPPAPDRPESPPPAASGEARAGTDFGQYRLLERIGLGGMAEVWKARMTGVEGFQKTVAIKKILAHLTDSADFVDMFIDEAKLAAQLNHANIIHIYDLGKIDGDYYIAMEYVEGENLRAILNAARAEGRPLPVGLALFIAAKLASALDYAHHKRDFEDRSLELVHRDVSPQNVLVGYEGTIKLCDFGIVKAVSKSSHTRMGALKGKLQYMSPEQAWGRAVDARSDIFSLGSLLFEMLTGRRLFRGDSEMEVLEAVRECRVQAPGELDPSVPEEVDAVVLKALAADPDDRYQKAGEMARRLEEILVSMRPSPGQGELAAYMRELFERLDDLPPAPAAPAGGAEAPAPAKDEAHEQPEPPPWAPSAEETPRAPELPELGSAELPDRSAPPPSEPGTGPAPTPRDEPSGVGEPPREVEEPRSEDSRAADPFPSRAPEVEDGDATGTAVPPPASTVDAVEPVGDVEPEEGGKTGKTVLILAILAALVAAAVLYWFVWRPRMAGESSPDAPPAPQASEDPAASRETPPAGDGPGGEQTLDAEAPGESDEPADGDTGSTPPRADGATGTDGEPAQDPDRASDQDLKARVEQTLEEKLAREEEELRRQYEEKQRELAERLAEAERRAESPASPPGPETGDRVPADSTEASESAPAERAGQQPETAPTPEESPASAPEPTPPSGASGTAAAEPARSTGSGSGRPASAETPPSAGGESPASTSDEPADGGSAAAEADPEEPSGRPAAGTGSSEPEPVAESDPEPEPEPKPSVRVGDLVQPGPGVTPPQLVTFEKPEYPPVARRLRVEGTVVVSVLVDENGDVTDTRLKQRVRQKVGINEAALEAARRAKYQPATKDGVRVKMWTSLRIPFRQ